MTDRTRPFEIDDLVRLKNAGDDWDGWTGVIALREGEVRRTEPHLDALGRLRVDLDRRPGAYADAPSGCLGRMPLPYVNIPQRLNPRGLYLLFRCCDSGATQLAG